MSTENSDLGVRGVFAAEPISLMTPSHPVEQVSGLGDAVLFELLNYVRLVCDQNPDVVELLCVDSSDVLFEDPAWTMLRERRSDLLTTKVRSTYGGFAVQALKQMRGHERWLNRLQPEQAPVPRDFVSTAHDLALDRNWNGRIPLDGSWTAVGIGSDLYLLYEGGSGSWFDASGNSRTFVRDVAASFMNPTCHTGLEDTDP